MISGNRPFRSKTNALHVLMAMAGVLAVGVLVRLMGYPFCRNDETNWAQIADALEQGRAWPVSGPLHVGAVRLLSEWLNVGHAAGLALLALVFMPVLMGVLVWGYGRFPMAVGEHARELPCPQQAVSWPYALAALMLSSYFWAPVLESRPQQWGVILLFASMLLLWQVLCPEPPGSGGVGGMGGASRLHWLAWLYFGGVLLLTAGTHILTYAVALCMAVSLGVALWVVGWVSTRALACLLAAIGISLLPFLLPDGPYAVMLADLRNAHLRLPSALGNGGYAEWVVLGGAAGLALGVALLWALRGRLARLSLVWHAVRAAGLLDERRRVVCVALAAGMCVGLLLLQAALLPDAAWMPYRQSSILFAASQLGNVAFAVLTFWGLSRAVTLCWRFAAREALVVIQYGSYLLAVALAGLCALAGSFFMLDTNWLLRIVNYAVFFAAPFAGLALAELVSRWPLAWCFAGVLTVVSLVSAIRVPQLFACSV